MKASPHTEPWIGTDPEPEDICLACECPFIGGYRITLTDLKYCGPCVKGNNHVVHFRDTPEAQGLTGDQIWNVCKKEDLIKI